MFAQHSWLLGILCGSPIIALLVIGMWTAMGASSSKNPSSGLEFFYWLLLLVFAGGMGVLLTQGLSILLNQGFSIPRFLAIGLSLPVIGLFISSLSGYKVSEIQPTQAISEWIPFIICCVCLPTLVALVWRAYGNTFTVNETLLVSVSDLASSYLPWFVLSWSTIFSFLTIFAYGMGGEMLHPSSSMGESISILLKPLLQYQTCVLISLRSSLGLTSVVLVLCETFRILVLTRG